MTRDQFMTELAMGLSDMPRDVVKELLNDMDEYFRDGLNQGKTEEEICNQLGSVEDFISVFKEAEGKRSSSREVSVCNNRVNLSVNSGDIRISHGDIFEVIYDKDYYELIQRDHDGQQDIELKPKHKQSGLGRLINLAINNVDSQVEVKVPKVIDRIDVHGDFGDIKAKGIMVSTMVLATDKGDIEISKCSGDDLHVANHLGDIDIRKNTFKKIDAKTNAGDITIDQDGGTIHANSDLGDITIHGMVDTIKANNSKGDIEFDGILNDSGHLKTSMGDIDIVCDDVTIHASTSLGDIDGQGCHGNGSYTYGNGHASLYASTSMGDITIND